MLQLLRTAIGYFNEDNFLTRLLKDDDALFSAFITAKYHAIVEEELIAIIAGAINEGKRRGRIRDVDEHVVAYAGLKLFQAFSYMRTGKFPPGKEDQEYYTTVLTDFIATALENKQR